MGYEGFDNPGVVPLLNDLYTNEWRLLMNFFLPSVKLTEKQHVKSRLVKTYDAPKTPLQRMLESSSHVTPHHKRELKKFFHQLNPFLLQECVSLQPWCSGTVLCLDEVGRGAAWLPNGSPVQHGLSF